MYGVLKLFLDMYYHVLMVGSVYYCCREKEWMYIGKIKAKSKMLVNIMDRIFEVDI